MYSKVLTDDLSYLTAVLSFLKHSIKHHFISLILKSGNPYPCNLPINPPETQGLSESEKSHITTLIYENDVLYFIDEFNQKYELMQLDVETLLDLLTQI